MTICTICNKQIRKNQKMAVVSYPVTCSDDNGDYSFLGDFTKNEKLYHLECFRSKSLNNSKPVGVTKPNNTQSVKYVIAKDFLETLKDLGETTTMQDVIRFMSKYQEVPELGELIGEWFKNRKEFV